MTIVKTTHAPTTRFGRRLRLHIIAVALSGGLVAGCGGVDAVELNGGVFDLFGVSGNLLGGKTQEKKMAPRAGLVMPPTTQALPAPGSGSVAALPPGQAWPQSPEDRAAADKARLKAEHDAYCEKEMARQRVVNPSDPNAIGPLGPCGGTSMGRALSRTLGGGQASSQQ